MLLSLFTITVNVALFWLFIDYWEWGFVGAPAALSVAEGIQALLFLLFAPRLISPDPDPGPSALSSHKPLLQVGAGDRIMARIQLAGGLYRMGRNYKIVTAGGDCHVDRVVCAHYALGPELNPWC